MKAYCVHVDDKEECYKHPWLALEYDEENAYGIIITFDKEFAEQKVKEYSAEFPEVKYTLIEFEAPC